MSKGRISIIPAAVALGALFMVLPRGGADAEVGVDAVSGGWRYAPTRVEVASGERVAFVNDSGTTHTATCQGCPWDTGDIQPGQTVMITFDDEASGRFACRYHGGQGMVGELVIDGRPAADPQPSPPA